MKDMYSSNTTDQDCLRYHHVHHHWKPQHFLPPNLICHIIPPIHLKPDEIHLIDLLNLSYNSLHLDSDPPLFTSCSSQWYIDSFVLDYIMSHDCKRPYRYGSSRSHDHIWPYQCGNAMPHSHTWTIWKTSHTSRDRTWPLPFWPILAFVARNTQLGNVTLSPPANSNCVSFTVSYLTRHHINVQEWQ